MVLEVLHAFVNIAAVIRYDSSYSLHSYYNFPAIRNLIYILVYLTTL